MTTDRKAATALVLGSAAGLVIMGLHPTGHSAARDMQAFALNYTWTINQAFASVSAAVTGIAVLLWSVCMLRTADFGRPLAVYGILLGALLLVGILSGHLRLNIHGFGAVVLGQGVWMVWVVTRLWQGRAV